MFVFVYAPMSCTALTAPYCAVCPAHRPDAHAQGAKRVYEWRHQKLPSAPQNPNVGWAGGGSKATDVTCAGWLMAFFSLLFFFSFLSKYVFRTCHEISCS